MSPLLGSSGGSSEYAFRGTLDDWPVAFDADITAQNLTDANPGDTVTASLTVAGINYKARITVDHPNTTVSVNGNTPVVAGPSDPEVFVRDNDSISVIFEIPRINVNSFSTLYGIPIDIGKRSAAWIIGTRAIDDTPDAFSFTNLVDQDLDVPNTLSNIVTISGLESGFVFNVQVLGTDYLKNGVSFTGITTIANNDTLQISATTSPTFNTTETYTITVGTFNTTWSITTRNVDNAVDPFTFIDIIDANQLGIAYTSNRITVTGIDSGPLLDPPNPAIDATAVPVAINFEAVSFNGGYEIRKSDGSLRYLDPIDPGNPNYFQNNVIGGPISNTNYAYLNDTIEVRIDAPTSYSSKNDLILDINSTLDTFSVSTRPTPIDSIPDIFTFIAKSGQNRGFNVFSDPITLSGMNPGDNGSALITSASPLIDPRFQVSRGGVIVKSYTAPEPFLFVQNGDEITLRMTTPNPQGGNGEGTYFINFAVEGIETPDSAGNTGFDTITDIIGASWNVSTIARTCPITIDYNGGGTSFTDVTLATRNVDYKQIITPDSFEIDCEMRATLSATGTGTNYNFTGRGNPIVPITPVKTLSNLVPGEQIEITVRSGPNFLDVVTASVTISNAQIDNPATPDNTLVSDTWSITNAGNTANTELTLTASPTTGEVNTNVTLTWNSINLRPTNPFRDANWTLSPLPNNGTDNVTLPANVPIPNPPGEVTFTLSFWANPDALNYDSLPLDGTERFIQDTATVSVTDDLTATFTPNDFGDLVRPIVLIGGPTRVESEEIIASGITADITVSPNEANTRTNVGGAGYSNIGNKTVSNNTTISMDILNNNNYLDASGQRQTNTGSITFSDGNGTKTFTVIAEVCDSPVSGAILFPSDTDPNRISYRQTVNPVDWGNGTSPNYLFEKPIPVSGSFGQYWVTRPGNPAVIPSFDGTNPTPWTDIIDAAFQIYNQEFWRVSTDTITTLAGYYRNPTLPEFEDILQSFGFTMASAQAAGTPITSITELIDATINGDAGARPTNLTATVRSLNSLIPPGGIQTGRVHNSCNIAITI